MCKCSWNGLRSLYWLQCMRMSSWTGVQTLVRPGGGLNDDTHPALPQPSPPTCCCLQWISDVSPLRRQQDTHMDTAGEGKEGVLSVKLIKMLQILFTDELPPFCPQTSLRPSRVQKHHYELFVHASLKRKSKTNVFRPSWTVSVGQTKPHSHLIVIFRMHHICCKKLKPELDYKWW